MAGKIQKMAGKIQKMAGKTDSLFCEALLKSGFSIFRSVVWFSTSLPQLLPTHTADKDRAHFKSLTSFLHIIVPFNLCTEQKPSYTRFSRCILNCVLYDSRCFLFVHTVKANIVSAL
jgi:hypothetical protein